MPLTNLKPTFYRVDGTLAVQSGWINTVTGDICDTEQNDHWRIKVIPGARCAFAVGERIEFTAPIMLYAEDVVAAGERGHVASIDEEGVVAILLEGVHDGVQDNTLTLVPFRDEDTLACLRVFKPPVARKVCERASPSLWWSGVIFTAVVPVALMLSTMLPPVTATILFGVAIVLTAIVLGQSHALVLAMLFPVARNLFIVPPALDFTAPTADEYFREAAWLTMALVVPWLCQHTKRLRKALVRWESELIEGPGKEEEGLN